MKLSISATVIGNVALLGIAIDRSNDDSGFSREPLDFIIALTHTAMASGSLASSVSQANSDWQANTASTLSRVARSRGLEATHSAGSSLADSRSMAEILVLGEVSEALEAA